MDIKQLLQDYKGEVISSKKLIFNIKNKDVYNITYPFEIHGKEYILGRVESRKKHDSKIMFFIKSKGIYILDKKAPVLDLEDPFINKINNEIIIGGVDISSKKSYKTIFFLGKNIYNLKKIKEGPKGMKDIRLILLPNNKIGIFTRPQGKIGGRGRIGFIIVKSIKEFSKLSLKEFYLARLIPDRFDKDEWLGVNAAYILKSNKLGILGHIARFSKNKSKEYYPITFDFDYLSNDFSKMKIILSRNELPKGESKTQELINVLFPGGLIRNSDGTAKLYVGAGDAEAYEVLIKDPFL